MRQTRSFGVRNRAPENDEGNQPAGLASLTFGLGLAAALGFAGFAADVSADAGAAGLAAASGLALAWRTAAGLAAGFAAASVVLSVPFGSAAVSCLRATRDRLPRFAVAASWFEESAATAATRPAPERVGPV